jgi:hypothetical protein
LARTTDRIDAPDFDFHAVRDAFEEEEDSKKGRKGQSIPIIGKTAGVSSR